MPKKVMAAYAFLFIVAPSVTQATCVVRTTDLSKLTTTAQIRSTGRLSFIDPCEGVAKGDLTVMGYTTRDSSQKFDLHQGENLKKVAAVSRGLEDPGNFYAATKIIASNLQERSGAQRFDPISGLVLGGPVVVEAPLTIPLGAYAWNETQKVTLSYGGQTVTLTPKNGTITVVFKKARPKLFVLKQADRQASFEAVDDTLDAEFASKYAALKNELQGEDRDFAKSQLASLFWEWGLSNNAVSVTYEDQ